MSHKEPTKYFEDTVLDGCYSCPEGCVCTEKGISCTFKICDAKCIDSDAQCKGKEDGTHCILGVWCDENGKTCGGESCVDLGVGICIKEKCVGE